MGLQKAFIGAGDVMPNWSPLGRNLSKKELEEKLKRLFEMNGKFQGLNIYTGVWVGIKSTGQVGFVVKEYDNGDRYSVMVIYGTKKDDVADAIKMVEKDDLSLIKDQEMLRLLYGEEEKER